MRKDPEGRVHALRNEKALEEILNKTKTSAAAHPQDLKMPDPAGSRVSKTPSRFRSTTEAEDVVPTEGVASWRREFFEALDLVQSEIKRRFDQSGMETVSRREETLLAAAKGSVGTEEDLRSLQLPGNIDVTSGLHMQMRMLGDLTKDDDFCTVHELAVYMSNLHMQTRVLFKDVENLLQCVFQCPSPWPLQRDPSRRSVA